jgi:arylsulfatase A-like enzyme
MKKLFIKLGLRINWTICLNLFFINVQAQQKPNIIFILADDLGYGDLSCYGAKDVQTPALDALAQRGFRFTRAYANSTVCSPSRASILTGNYPDLVGVPGVIRDMPNNTWGNLKDDVTTLPEALKGLNYTTALIGKWHLGYKSPDLPNNRGFEFFKGFVGDMMDDYYTHKRAGVNWMRENTKEINPEGHHATDLFTNWTLSFLEAQKKQEKPFFLFLAYNAPHDPVQPPQEWLDKIQKREINASLKRQKLIALIEHLDFNVGRVLSALKNNKLDDNTIVVFTSDNGGSLQHGASNLPFSGGKGDMLEGGIRVPCIVKLPFANQGRTINDPLLLMDFYSTLIKFGGGKDNFQLPSTSINSLFNLPPNTANRNMVWVRREGNKYGGKSYYAISDGTFKLMQNNPFSEYKLFNLIKDPDEAIPINTPINEHPLWKELTKHIQNSGKIPWQ